MKKLLLSTGLVLLVMAAYAQSGTEWCDMAVNEVNRHPIRTNFFNYESRELALENDMTKSSNYLSLNGIWKFKWVENADERPDDFYLQDTDDATWATMPVPGMWELNGFGDPLYVNMGFAWKSHYENNPPYPPVRDNHVGSYRRVITVPADWDGRQVIAHFGSVTSNIYLYVNGQFVGYAEDSKIAAEFDVTPYVHSGDNLFAFQVFRWCDGSYCEDQDFWRLSGVARDSYLYAMNPDRQVTDLRITPDLVNDYAGGTLRVQGKTIGDAAVRLELLRPDGGLEQVCDTKTDSTGIDIILSVDDPLKWTAETPNLYTLIVSVYLVDVVGHLGQLLSSTTQKVGFRKVEIKGERLLVNGKPIYIKGVDRHEMDPTGGYVVSHRRMEQDLRIMKELNVNAIRTCHYPDDPMFYDMCDQYGFYVVAEANQESHGFGYRDGVPPQTELFRRQIVERNQHNVATLFNHPSIIMWSLGNETIDGPNFTEAFQWIKRTDPSRPIHWERAQKGENTEVFCPMYASQEYCQKYADSDGEEDRKPLIQCEYNHAMGNSSGGFKEYWDIVRQDKRFQGGFIWDFVDQALWGVVKTGQGSQVRTLTYGGDYNDYDASDENFNCNGFITADRKKTPQAYEIGYEYQNIWTRLLDVRTGKISVRNENFFRSLKNIRLCWELLADGVAVRWGTVENLDIPARETCEYTLGYDTEGMEGELLLNVSYNLKDAEPLLETGHVAAHQQFQIAPYDYATHIVDLQSAGHETKITFNKETGLIEILVIDGESILGEGGTLRPSFWRAVTDNDMGAGLQHQLKPWREPVMKLMSLRTRRNVTTATYDMPEVKAVLTLTYTVEKNGCLKVNQKLTTTPYVDVPRMFRFGMIMELPYTDDVSRFYGRGPIENYSDRPSGQTIGIYEVTADDQFWPYVRPQETGSKTDIRWWQQGPIEIVSDSAFTACALHYSVTELDEGDMKSHRHPEQLEKSAYTNLFIDEVMAGVGGINSWSGAAEALPKYRVEYKDRDFTFYIIKK